MAALVPCKTPPREHHSTMPNDANSTPSLDTSFHIAWSRLVPEAVVPDVREALELARKDVTVNAVCPNHVTTGLGSVQNAYFSAFKGMTEAAYLEEMAARIPVGRIGQVEDTAALCAFLASDEASFITGEAINVSGGEEMH